MRKNGKKALSMLLALVMVLGMLPGTAWAAEESGAEAVSPAAEDVQLEESENAQIEASEDVQSETPENAQPEAPDDLQPDKEPEEPQPDEVPDEPDSSPELYADTVKYPVTGGNLSFNPSTGTITGCGTSVTSITIPSSINGVDVTGIGEQAFSSCQYLTCVTIPDSVTSIGRYAFWQCTSLTSVSIPDSVTSIGSYAFQGCTGLTTAGPIGGGYSYEFGWTKEIPANAFYFCERLTSVTIPGSVTSIGESAFAVCTGLTSVSIPDSVTSIGDSTFEFCRGLTSVSIGDGVRSIEGLAREINRLYILT